MQMIKIIIADDHQMVREGLRSLLKGHPEIKVIAEAEDGRTAVRLAEQLLPDIVVMDLAMPDLNGVEATRQLTSNGHNIKVVALSGRASAHAAAEALQAGASGFVRKESAFQELTDALHAAMDKRVYLSPAIAEAVHAEMHEANGVTPHALSSREREVLQLMAVGKATKEIARDLHVSVKNIETHRRNLMEKLKLYDVAELTKHAIRQGVTSIDT